MKRTIPVGALLILFCISVSQAFAQSSVWKVTRGENYLFIGGTIHLLAEEDYPLPPAFEKAYAGSACIVLETDLQKFGAADFQQTILQYTMYQGDEDIIQHLDPDTLLALNSFLKGNGIPLAALAKLKPGMLSVTLTMIELQKLGLAGIGVDEYFSFRATAESKELRYLESVHEQLEFLATLGLGSENELIEYTLNDMQALPDIMGKMKQAWQEGDIEQLQLVALEPWVDRFPALYESLLVERNTNWLPKIEQMLATEEVEFILIGVLHLAGKDGLLTQLQNAGYCIEMLF